MARKCCICDGELALHEMMSASWATPKTFCEGCLRKFKQAKKELAGKSDDEVINSIKFGVSQPPQQEAGEMTFYSSATMHNMRRV